MQLDSYFRSSSVCFIHFLCTFLWFSHSPFNGTCPPCFVSQASLEDDSVKQSEYSNAMVGQASENVEAGRTGGGINDISYLDDISDPHSVVCNTASTASLKSIKAEIKQESEVVPETVYGTYDEATNSITIFYGEENGDCVNIQECVQEVVSTGEQQLESVCPVVEDTGVATHLTVSSANHTSYPTQFSPTYKDAMSPATSDVYSDADSAGVFTAAFHATKLDCASPDGGYESHDSPDSRQSNLLTDLGMESFTELFPELLTWQFSRRRAATSRIQATAKSHIQYIFDNAGKAVSDVRSRTSRC